MAAALIATRKRHEDVFKTMIAKSVHDDFAQLNIAGLELLEKKLEKAYQAMTNANIQIIATEAAQDGEQFMV